MANEIRNTLLKIPIPDLMREAGAYMDELHQRINELERDKENVREWTRKHRNLIFYVAETHSIPDFMLEALADD